MIHQEDAAHRATLGASPSPKVFDMAHFRKLAMNVSNTSYQCGKHAEDEDGAIELHHKANEADLAIIAYAEQFLASPSPKLPEGGEAGGEVLTDDLIYEIAERHVHTATNSDLLIARDIEQEVQRRCRAQRTNNEVSRDPVAYLHEVVCGDGEPDQALSFASDNFPLAGTLGYRSLSHQPLFTAAPAPAPAGGDAARLEFIMEREAWIAWTKDGERCRVFHRDDDGDTCPMMGWVPEAFHGDPRAAIDAAMTPPVSSSGDAK